jgi:ABC-type Zn2+ transport system substrate-binding protein/surface adhesin
MMIVNNFVLGIAALLLSTAGLAADRIPVIASFSILGDLVSVVGGDRVAVSTLVGPDQDAHVFEPRPAGVKLVAQAKLFVVNGLGFEGWLDRLTRSADFKGVTVVASRGIQSRQMADEDHPSKLSSDPHAWQDPRNVIDYVRNIASALARLTPPARPITRKTASITSRRSSCSMPGRPGNMRRFLSPSASSSPHTTLSPITLPVTTLRFSRRRASPQRASPAPRKWPSSSAKSSMRKSRRYSWKT